MAQDGGLSAAIFNLVVVVLVTVLSEWIWGRWRTVLLFILPSIAIGIVLVALGDAHGVVILFGAAIGIVLEYVDIRRNAPVEQIPIDLAH